MELDIVCKWDRWTVVENLKIICQVIFVKRNNYTLSHVTADTYS